MIPESYNHEVQLTIEAQLDFTFTHKIYEHWFPALESRINFLILNNFEKLIFALYRLDVNEQKVKAILKASPGSDAGKLIGKLIIERQLQKIKTREAFHRQNPDIGENEKW